MNTRVKVITKRLMVIILSLTLIAGIPLSVGMAGGYDNAYAQEAVTGDEPAADDQGAFKEEADQGSVQDENAGSEDVVIEESAAQEPEKTNTDEISKKSITKNSVVKKSGYGDNWYFTINDKRVSSYTIPYSERKNSVELYLKGLSDNDVIKDAYIGDGDAITISNYYLQNYHEVDFTYEEAGTATICIVVGDKNDSDKEVIKSFTVTCEGASWGLSRTQVSLAKTGDEASVYITGDLDGYDIDKVESSNSTVVSTYLNSWNDEIELTRKGPGSAKVTVYANDGSSKEINVNCPLTAFKLSRYTVAFTSASYKCTQWVMNSSSNTDSYIKSVSSSNPRVARVRVDADKDIEIVAQRAGNSIVTARDSRGRTAKITVRVDKAWVSKNLKETSLCLIPYSSKKVYLQSKPGAKVVFKIKGKKYKRTIPKKGYVYVNLKKHYKLNTKFSVKFTYNGGVAKWKGKVYSNTNLWFRIYRYEKKCEVEVYNVTKGDIVYLKAGGKTYKKKIKRDAKKKTFVFKLKKYGGDIYHVKFIVKNKYKQTLYTWDQDLWRTYYRTIIYL